MTLPDCEHRYPTTNPAWHFCAHARVHAPRDFVRSVQCERCRWHAEPCTPRDVPENLIVAVPTIGRRVVNFAAAMVQHQRTGRRKATEAVQAARLATCESCVDYYDGQICRHPACGCGVSTARGLRHKLSLADQSCPIGRWTSVDPPE